MEFVQPPYSGEQIAYLNDWQLDGSRFCPADTCPYESLIDHGHENRFRGILIATRDGLVCPHCGFLITGVSAEHLKRERLYAQVYGVMGPMITAGAVIKRLQHALEYYTSLQNANKPMADHIIAHIRQRLADAPIGK